jgi:FkbM family methyltransferase
MKLSTTARRLKAKLENLLHVRVARYPLPKGWDEYHDIKTVLQGVAVRGIFDIGANVGQTALECAVNFPEAAIFSFEPVKDTFESLRLATRDFRQIRCWNLGFGDAAGEMSIDRHEMHSLDSLLPNLDEQRSKLLPSEVVTITTVDSFVKDQGITGLDILKIDTEGFDLHVLRGAAETLRRGWIKVIMVECGLGRKNARFVPLNEMSLHLDGFGFRLMGIFDQREWNGEHRIGLCNALFVSDQLCRW